MVYRVHGLRRPQKRSAKSMWQSSFVYHVHTLASALHVGLVHLLYYILEAEQ